MSTEVLVVDDTPEAAELAAAALSSVGYSVRMARGGAEALRLLDEAPAAVAIVDLMMPGMTGLALLDELVERDVAPSVIVLTAVTDEEVAKSARARGALDVLVKPVEIGRLRAAVQLLTGGP